MLPIIRCRHALLAAALIAVAGLSTGAYAQSDPPGRVARLNYISGQVSFRPASLDDWGVATLNYPLTTGDHLWTERDAIAELHAASSVLRLAPETAFAFLNLDDDVLQARVAEGTVDLRIRELFDREIYEVDTPNAAVSIVAPGIYRIDVDPDGSRTRVTVRAGEVEVDGNGRTFSVYPGQMAELFGDEYGGYALRRAAAPDRFERWCRDRDRREDNRLALNYVSRDMVGYEDLDDYGTWNYVPEYGYGWAPTVVAVDWAPYRYGHWSYVRPWGWTWVDHARWGFAPFHYGRWAFCRSRWMWFPGHRMVRPVWAPALVAFVGGRNWNFSFSFGVRPAVGWFPLAPGELYCPSYYASRVYVRNVNVTNVNVTNVNMTNVDVATMRYANRNVAGATTAVPRDMFASAQPTQRVGIAVPRYAAAQTPVVGHAAAVTPGAASVLGHVPTNAARPPASVMERAVVARTEPPAAAARRAPVVPPSEGGRAARHADADTTPRRTTDEGASARPRGYDDNSRARTAQSDEPGRPRDWRPGRGRGESGNEQQPSNRTDIYAVPRESSRPEPSGTPARRARDTESSGAWRPAPGRTTEAPTPQRDERPDYAPESRYERATPRSDRPSSGYERPTPRDERPSPSYERSTPRDERPASTYERPPARDERPSGGMREAPAPTASARPRDDDRPSPPARAERSEAPRSEAHPPAAAPAQSARPADRPAERPPSQSGGRGGQSEGSARPRGGRGGVK